jgi:hypothetical protein
MPLLSEKTLKALRLDEAGYAYNFDRMMYINRQVKKAFSREYVEDNPESVIASNIKEPNDDGDWHFYMNTQSESVKRELKRVLQ